jgi:hypothetical protein
METVVVPASRLRSEEGPLSTQYVVLRKEASWSSETRIMFREKLQHIMQCRPRWYPLDGVDLNVSRDVLLYSVWRV